MIVTAVGVVLVARQLSGGVDEVVDLVRRTWHTNLHALADRALVRELTDTERP